MRTIPGKKFGKLTRGISSLFAMAILLILLGACGSEVANSTLTPIASPATKEISDDQIDEIPTASPMSSPVKVHTAEPESPPTPYPTVKVVVPPCKYIPK